MTVAAIALAAAFVTAEGGEELEDFQTTESKGFREIATSGFTIHPYPAVEALDVDAARERHEFLALGASLTDASAWVLANMPAEKRQRLLRELHVSGQAGGRVRTRPSRAGVPQERHRHEDMGTRPQPECQGGGGRRGLVRKIQRRRLVIKYKGLYKSLPMPGEQCSVSTLVFK